MIRVDRSYIATVTDATTGTQLSQSGTSSGNTDYLCVPAGNYTSLTVSLGSSQNSGWTQVYEVAIVQ